MLEWFMNRYRGKRGLFGWLVLRADVRWLNHIVRVAKEEAKKEI